MPPTARQPERPATPVAKAVTKDITEVKADDPALLASRADVGDSQPAAVARESQFPSLIGSNGVEVAQRTIDREHLDADPTATATQYVKVFTLLKREYDEFTDEQKERLH